MKHWNERYRAAAQSSLAAPRAAVVELAEHLPASGSAIDVAGGNGATSLWLAERGFDVVLCDVSTVALEQATAAATELDVSLRVEHRDVETSGIEGRWDLIVITYFLHRPLLADVGRHLNVGGVLLFVQPTETNLERNARPSRRFLLADGEIDRLNVEMEQRAATDDVELTTVHASEQWRNGTHEARLIVSRTR